MPDPILMLQALAAAVVVSALVVVAGRLLDRRWAGTVQAMAVGLGAGVGLAVLGVRPKWPMREDQDRLLGLVLPAVLVLEALLARASPPSWMTAGARLVASVTVAPALLYGSTYIVDLAGPGTAEWGAPPARYVTLGGLGLALFGLWSVLAWASNRADSAVRAPIALATAIGGAGVAVMLSGYASGGMNGVPLAGAIGGGALAAGLWKGDGRAAVPGLGAVALFSLLLTGYCFGELKPDAATALFLAPTLAAVPEVPPLSRRLRPWLRTACAFILVGLATTAVVALTAYRFQTVAAGPAPVGGPSADDYSEYLK